MKKSFSDRFLRKTSPAVSLTDLKTDSPDKPKGSPARSRSGIVKTTPNEKTFTDFAKLSLIGKGAVGKVYVVVEKDTFMMYAMKVLSKQEMIAREKVGRVMLEKDMLISLNHPFIVPLHHCFQSPNYIYMIMDYCAGGELYNVLQRSPTKTLSESVAKFIIAEIISALEYLHLQGYIYRDLKPENILVQASGHIMLADFDLSKDAGESEAKPEIIKSRGLFNQINAEATLADMKAKSFVGTEEYVSPEALLGNGYSSSVDWWSTGVLLYEMLYGSTPFVGKNQKATFRNILRKDPPFKHTNKTQSVTVSTEAKAFIKKMLIKDPKKRIGSKFGAAELKAHPFFKDTNFTLLRNKEPPYKPEFKNRYDLSNFKEFEENTAVLNKFQEMEEALPSILRKQKMETNLDDDEVCCHDIKQYLQTDPHASKIPANSYYTSENTAITSNSSVKMKSSKSGFNLHKALLSRSTAQMVNMEEMGKADPKLRSTTSAIDANRQTNGSFASLEQADSRTTRSSLNSEDDDPFKDFEQVTVLRNSQTSLNAK